MYRLLRCWAFLRLIWIMFSSYIRKALTHTCITFLLNYIPFETEYRASGAEHIKHKEWFSIRLTQDEPRTCLQQGWQLYYEDGLNAKAGQSVRQIKLKIRISAERRTLVARRVVTLISFVADVTCSFTVILLVNTVKFNFGEINCVCSLQKWVIGRVL